MAMSSISATKYGEVSSYSCPTWTKKLKVIPKSRVELCMRPTPIHKWTLPDLPDGFEVSIKREDLTGSTLSGNKVRKLEFLLSDAKEQGCDTIITFGGLQSNHARATAVAARELGMEPYIFSIDFTPESSSALSGSSNSLVMKLVGANFVNFPLVEGVDVMKQVDDIQEVMLIYADKLRSEGRKPYVIPKGGASILGTWGYIDGFDEMMQQGVLDDYDDVFVASGCVGTASALAISNYLTGSKLKIHAVTIHSNEQYIYDHIESDLEKLGLTDIGARDIIDGIGEYVGEGYGKSTEEELDAIVDVMSHTGISLDPDFTVKSYLGMVGEMKKNPSRFKGNRVLYIHTDYSLVRAEKGHEQKEISLGMKNGVGVVLPGGGKQGGVYVLFDGRIALKAGNRPTCNKTLKSSDLNFT